ncbi:hypothetical protein Sru01_52820 [Sphaerisporangium rufum]|uniref:Uncharacterized protein n=1 Tax=Sphaerisporangium rufum TaxID=1381558 RepID=A0A919RAE6_9ACTN|nr:hypothetical protein [Sphaerisporangium rufum]GII80300.1 hypothetical protein Sru01_52820 [Sphaerisporangium rufum]
MISSSSPAAVAPGGAPAARPAAAPGRAGPLTALWAATYGLLALAWTVTGRGYPYGPNDRGGGDLGPVHTVSPEVAAPVLAAVLLATSVAALAMSGRHAVRLAGPARVLLLGFGWTVTAILIGVIPSPHLLALAGYAPMLILGAPFGWPKGVDYSVVFNWSNAGQAWTVLGGFLLAATVLGWQRRTRGACAACGRDGDRTAADRARWARIGRWATGIAVVVPLLYAVDRFAWLLHIPLGISDAQLATLWATGGVWAGTGLATFATAGALLTLGLVRPFGEVFPRWLPGLAGRPVPVRLAVVPAAIVSAIVMSGGIGIVTSPIMWRMMPGPVGLVIHGLWPVWSVALGLAAFAYYLRRRSACGTCGGRG